MAAFAAAMGHFALPMTSMGHGERADAATTVAEAAGGTDVLRNPAEPYGDRHTAFIDRDART